MSDKNKKKPVDVWFYGMQRSGTNVIKYFLKNACGVKFAKRTVKTRDNPQGKHFRCYATELPIKRRRFVPELFGKNYTENVIASVEDLDVVLGDKTHTNLYVVAYKDILSWLPSIQTWWDKCKISPTREDDINDYLHYISYWKKIANSRVLFINYIDYLNYACGNNDKFLEQINGFFTDGCHFDSSFTPPETVRCSRQWDESRMKYYLNKEYLIEYSVKDLYNIMSHPLFDSSNVM